MPSSASPPAGAERVWLGPALALVGAIGFSAKAIFAKLAYADSSLDALTLVALRMIFSIPFFAAMAWAAQRDASLAPLTRRDWATIVALGFIGYYLSSLLDFWGLMYISASLERLILFLNPTIVVVMSALLLRKPITRTAIAAIILSYAGILIVFAHDLHLSTDTTSLLIGSGLVFASALSYATYLVWNGEIIRRVGVARFTAYGMASSTLFVCIHFLAARPLSMLVQPVHVYWNIGAMAVFSTVLPMWLINEAIRRIGSPRAALIGTIGPIMTIALGAMFLGEPITWVQITGALLVISGVALVMLRR